MSNAITVEIEGDTFIRLNDGGVARPCSRCGGNGRITGFEFIHQGICFRCNGSRIGKRFASEADAGKAVIASRTRAAKVAAEKEAERVNQQNEVDVWRTLNANFIADLETFGDYGFLLDLSEQARFRILSDRQVSVAKIAIEKVKAKRVAGSQKAYIGNVNDKVTLTGNVTNIASFNSQYGVTFIVTIDVDGNDVVVKGRNDFIMELDKNDRVTFTATIKEHSEYRGVKQTIVQRPKMV